MNTTARRITELTDQQRQAIDHARRLLAPHFPGETVRLYCPQQAIEAKLERESRIREALCAGLAPAEISRREGVSRRTVYALRGRLVCKFPP